MEANITAYDKDLNKIYDLKKALTNAKIVDKALAELAKTNNNVKPILSSEAIDFKSIIISGKEIKFSSNANLGCQGKAYSGSTYKVLFNGNTFTEPQFVNINECIGG